ncbi:transposase [Streptomyces similanensis]|uniref:transposase n=1 Tax=Streptomyces similanensis TaxID=1274988 RepID=UPI003CD081C4
MDHGGVIRRHELTDHEWELLAPLIPRAATGRPRAEDRQIINETVYKIRTAISWRDLLEHPFPPLRTGRRLHSGSPTDPGFRGSGRRRRPARPDRLHHRPCSPAGCRHRPKRGIHWPDEPDDHALGRSRGEPTTKIHLACDGKGRPLARIHDMQTCRPPDAGRCARRGGSRASDQCL